MHDARALAVPAGLLALLGHANAHASCPVPAGPVPSATIYAGGDPASALDVLLVPVGWTEPLLDEWREAAGTEDALLFSAVGGFFSPAGPPNSGALGWQLLTRDILHKMVGGVNLHRLDYLSPDIIDQLPANDLPFDTSILPGSCAPCGEDPLTLEPSCTAPGGTCPWNQEVFGVARAPDVEACLSQILPLTDLPPIDVVIVVFRIQERAVGFTPQTKLGDPSTCSSSFWVPGFDRCGCAVPASPVFTGLATEEACEPFLGAEITPTAGIGTDVATSVFVADSSGMFSMGAGARAAAVAAHEGGHALGELADEYFDEDAGVPGTVPPATVNCESTDFIPGDVRWSRWKLFTSTDGIASPIAMELEGCHHNSRLWRPLRSDPGDADGCMMRTSSFTTYDDACREKTIYEAHDAEDPAFADALPDVSPRETVFVMDVDGCVHEEVDATGVTVASFRIAALAERDTDDRLFFRGELDAPWSSVLSSRIRLAFTETAADDCALLAAGRSAGATLYDVSAWPPAPTAVSFPAAASAYRVLDVAALANDRSAVWMVADFTDAATGAVDCRVLRSLDGGATFDFEASLPVLAPGTLVSIAPESNELLVVAAGPTVFELSVPLTGGPVGFTSFVDGLPGDTFKGVSADPIDPLAALYVVTDTGAYRRTPGGTWGFGFIADPTTPFLVDATEVQALHAPGMDLAFVAGGPNGSAVLRLDFGPPLTIEGPWDVSSPALTYDAVAPADTAGIRALAAVGLPDGSLRVLVGTENGVLTFTPDHVDRPPQVMPLFEGFADVVSEVPGAGGTACDTAPYDATDPFAAFANANFAIFGPHAKRGPAQALLGTTGMVTLRVALDVPDEQAGEPAAGDPNRFVRVVWRLYAQDPTQPGGFTLLDSFADAMPPGREIVLGGPLGGCTDPGGPDLCVSGDGDFRLVATAEYPDHLVNPNDDGTGAAVNAAFTYLRDCGKERSVMWDVTAVATEAPVDGGCRLVGRSTPSRPSGIILALAAILCTLLRNRVSRGRSE